MPLTPRPRRFALEAADARGAVLIEFAFALPLLLLFIVGIVDFGLLFQQYQVLTNAAREGARMAVLSGYSEVEGGDIQTRVAQYVSAGGVAQAPTTTVEDTMPATTGAPFLAKKVTVTLPYTFTFLGPFASRFGGTFGTVTLTAISVMRVEVASGGF